MKKCILLLLGFLVWQLTFSQKNQSLYTSNIKKADSLLQKKEYKSAGLAYAEAFKNFGGKGYIPDRFNAARAWAMANTPDSAFDCLNRIIKKRYFTNYDSLANEKDFTLLHTDKRWQPLLALLKQNDLYKVPKGWFVPAAISFKYLIGVDKGTGKDGKNAVTIMCNDWEEEDSFGNLMQNFSPGKFLGKRVRMSAYMKSKDLAKWASFWMRVDKAASKQYLSFDNMLDGKENRAIKGTTDWKKYEIVLDVPESASNIAFGCMMEGKGQIWFDNFSFEIVDTSVPLTGMAMEQKDPVNLSFEE